jgi:membrane protein YdbS with pleckstrin-like domain
METVMSGNTTDAGRAEEATRDGHRPWDEPGPRRRVSRRARTWWTWQAAIPAVALLAVVDIPLVLLGAVIPLPVSLPVFGVSAVAAIAYVVIVPRRRYLVHRWETTGDAVYARSGLIWQSRRAAPLSRVQTVDAERGPLQQIWKLATVTVTTASSAGALKIPGLDDEVADELVRHLTDVARSAAADRA